METLVVGATGATGRLLVQQLLDRGQRVRAMVRSPDKLPEIIREHKHLTLIQATILDLSDAEVARQVRECSAVGSCLGHNLNWKGVFGHPRRLVTDATRRLCSAITSNKPREPVRFVLMNTAGNSNRDLDESMSFGHKFVILERLGRTLPGCLKTPMHHAAVEQGHVHPGLTQPVGRLPENVGA